MTHLHTFSRALRQLHVIASSFDWFTGLCLSFVIGYNYYFGFGFIALKTALKPYMKVIIPFTKGKPICYSTCQI